jgi:hypothetical protein
MGEPNFPKSSREFEFNITFRKVTHQIPISVQKTGNIEDTFTNNLFIVKETLQDSEEIESEESMLTTPVKKVSLMEKKHGGDKNDSAFKICLVADHDNSPLLGKRVNKSPLPSEKQKKRSKQSDGFTSLKTVTAKMAKKYADMHRRQKKMILLSYPDTSFTVEALLSQLEGPLPKPNQSTCLSVFEEFVIACNMGSEGILVYRDETSRLLMIYYKKIRSDNRDGPKTNVMILTTNIADLQVQSGSGHGNKMKLLFKDIAVHMEVREFVERVASTKFNKHMIILNSVLPGPEAKEFLSWDSTGIGYIQPIADVFCENIPTLGTIANQLPIVRPLISSLSFISFDLFQTKNIPLNTRLNFRELYEEQLMNEKGKTFVLHRPTDNPQVTDIVPLQIRASMRFGEVLYALKRNNRVKFFDEKAKLHLYMTDEIEKEGLKQQEKQPPERLIDWRFLKNKLLLYKLVGNGKESVLVNFFDVPKDFCAVMGVNHSPKNVTVVILLDSEREYIRILHKIFSKQERKYNLRE